MRDLGTCSYLMAFDWLQLLNYLGTYGLCMCGPLRILKKLYEGVSKSFRTES
jgi:hypothetical protein